MSFILEALKKSEQQRQQQGTPKQKLRKRTLSLSTNRSERRLLPWFLFVCLLLLLIGGWLLFPGTEATLKSSHVVVQEPKVVTPAPQAAAVTVIESTPALPSEAQGPVVVVETAPTPRSLAVQQAESTEIAAAKAASAAPTSLQVEAPVPQKMQRIEKPIATIMMDKPKPHAIDRESGETSSSKLPLYSELSNEWRERMPILEMSLHFYTTDPDRRIVRINDHLLRQGNWVDRNLQVVEITSTGAILDFLGKSFELRRNGR